MRECQSRWGGGTVTHPTSMFDCAIKFGAGPDEGTLSAGLTFVLKLQVEYPDPPLQVSSCQCPFQCSEGSGPFSKAISRHIRRFHNAILHPSSALPHH